MHNTHEPDYNSIRLIKKNPQIGNRDFTEFTSPAMQPAQIHYHAPEREWERKDQPKMKRLEWRSSLIHPPVSYKRSEHKERVREISLWFFFSFLLFFFSLSLSLLSSLSLFFFALKMRITSSNIQRLEWNQAGDSDEALWAFSTTTLSLIHHRQAKPPASRLRSAHLRLFMFNYYYYFTICKLCQRLI